ncbi:MAG: type II toxin-antitoxin system PemK/MazF family toxin [Beijerinckiaceae bacterium]
MVKQGDIWLVRFDPTIGSEIQKTRPAMVVSPAVMNDHLHTVIVAPMTTGSRPARFRVEIDFEEKQGLIVLDYLRSVDKRRFLRKLGVTSDETRMQSLAVLREMFSE